MKSLSETLYLSQIWIYPVKSLAGIRLSSAEIDYEGLRFDRNWMIVDSSGTFLSQRKVPEMSLLQVAMHAEGIEIFSKKESDQRLFVPFQTRSSASMEVKIWDDHLWADHVSEQADNWLSDRLNRDVRLVALNQNAIRETQVHFGKSVPIRFMDDYPLHLISEASLHELNTRLSQTIGIERFRPNLVIAGNSPYEEDTWQILSVGDAIIEMATSCERCVMINIDQDTAVKTVEPLKTLSTFRKEDKKIFFGKNVFCLQVGNIAEGDVVKLS